MESCTVASLKLKYKQVSTKANDIKTPIILFVQQLSSVILLKLLHIKVQSCRLKKH